MGALPTLFACVAPECPRDAFIGPDGWMGMGGFPAVVKEPGLAGDTELARKLWESSEEWAKIEFEI